MFLFLGEVLRAPATNEESADRAAAFLLGETGAGAAAARTEAFLFLDLVAGAAATGAEVSSAKSSLVSRTLASAPSPWQPSSARASSWPPWRLWQGAHPRRPTHRTRLSPRHRREPPLQDPLMGRRLLVGVPVTGIVALGRLP
jgi:hypothetical protein